MDKKKLSPQIVGTFLISGLILIMFYLIFSFAGLDMTLFFLGVQLSAVVLCIYLLGTIIYRRKEIDKEKMIESLQEENRKIKNEFLDYKKDMENYFLIWIHQIKTPIQGAYFLAKSDSAMKSELFAIENYTNMALNYLKLQDDSRDLNITEISIDNLVNPLLKKYSFSFIEKHLVVDYEKTDSTVVTDVNFAKVMIEQILSNAIKYTEKGKITITYMEERKELMIKDTGIGIKKSDIPKIFYRGYSGFNGRSQEKSTGIGLYIAKAISEKLNIEIKVESDTKEGTIFHLYFPQ